MPRWAKFAGIAAGVLLLIALLIGMLVQRAISGSARDEMVAQASQKLGVALKIGQLAVDWGALFRLRPAASVTGLTVGNPPGFTAPHLLTADRVSVQLALKPVFSGQIEVLSAEIESPQVTLERNTAGETNLETVLKKLSSQPSQEPGYEFRMNRLAIRNASLVINGQRNLDQLNLQLTDLAPKSACKAELAARLFGGANSKIEFQGTLGPLASASLPADGALKLQLAPAEVPAQLRQRLLGELLAAPGSGSRTVLVVKAKGDAYGEIGGPAELQLADVRIGRDAQHQLPLAGRAPGTFKVTSVLGTPAWELAIPAGAMQLGKGEWKGSLNAKGKGQSLAGNSAGSLRNIDVSELLRTFSTVTDEISGQLEMPRYELAFAGTSPAELESSLRGAADVQLLRGKIKHLDMLAALQNALGSATGGATGATEFATLNSHLDIAAPQIKVTSLTLDSAAGRITGAGVIGFNQTLNLNLAVALGGAAGGLVQQAGVSNVKVGVSGTLANPKVTPDVKGMAVQTGIGMAEKYLGGFLGKKKK